VFRKDAMEGRIKGARKGGGQYLGTVDTRVQIRGLHIRV
jgi:hypothetical protein